jgi:hypothetical protein
VTCGEIGGRRVAPFGFAGFRRPPGDVAADGGAEFAHGEASVTRALLAEAGLCARSFD